MPKVPRTLTITLTAEGRERLARVRIAMTKRGLIPSASSAMRVALDALYRDMEESGDLEPSDATRSEAA